MNRSRSGRGAVVPVVEAVHADDSIHRGIGVRGKFGLPLRVVGRQSSQGGQVAAGRTPRDGNEIGVTAEPLSVGPCPRDRSLDVGHLARPAVSRAGPVLN